MKALDLLNVRRAYTGRARLMLLAVAFLSGCASGPTSTASESATGADFSELPEQALRDIAQSIERQVMEGNREPVLDSQGGMVVDTPEIRQAARTRAARAELVSAFLDSGYGWERLDGHLWILRSGEYKRETTGQRKDLDAMMVNGENRDRRTIYTTLMKANGLPNRTREAIEVIFMESRLALMSPGQKFENSLGEPAVKQ